jgi:hypothetical protein
LKLDDGAVKNLASRKSVPASGLKITSCNFDFKVNNKQRGVDYE